jgi:hypothetical protein
MAAPQAIGLIVQTALSVSPSGALKQLPGIRRMVKPGET